jgi:hypothetical protein
MVKLQLSAPALKMSVVRIITTVCHARTFDLLPEIEASCRRVYRLGLGFSCARHTNHLLVGAKEKPDLLEHRLLRRGWCCWSIIEAVRPGYLRLLDLRILHLCRTTMMLQYPRACRLLITGML